MRGDGSLVRRILGEVRREIRAAFRGGTPSANAYGTIDHEARRRLDLAIHEEFHRRLKAAGVYVEGA